MLPARRALHLERWHEAWVDALANLNDFASHGYYGLDVEDLDACSQTQALQDWHTAALGALQLTQLAYSRGLPPAHLDTLFSYVLQCWNEYASMVRSSSSNLLQPPIPLDARQADYSAAVQLLALPILLDRQELIPGITERLLGNECDRLLDYLSPAACDKTEAAERFFALQPYAQLTPFFEQAEITVPPLQNYLQTAYASASATIFGDPYAATTPHQFRWAWEVAALVVLYGLDDSAFALHPHYPADLVAYARQRLARNTPQAVRA